MKILLIRLSSLGDVVLATAAVEALREARPEAAVEVLTKPAFRPVFQGNPGVSDVLAWEPALSLAALARQVRARGYDWIVDLHANLRTRLLRPLVPGPRWSVYSKGALRRRLAVWRHRPHLLRGEPHVVERYLAALAPLGGLGDRRLPRLYLEDDTRKAVGNRLRGAGWSGESPLVGLAPGARWATKAWPREHWVELVRQIGAGGQGMPVMVGGQDEAGLCDDILHQAGVAGVSLAGQASIRETAAALEYCAVLVTNDSAPMHIATAVGTRVVALFGPTVPSFGFRPLGRRDEVLEEDVACRPCSLHGDDRCPVGTHLCMLEITPEAVLSCMGG